MQRETRVHIDPATPITARAFNIEKTRLSGDVA
jgi:hypothetical protein